MYIRRRSALRLGLAGGLSAVAAVNADEPFRGKSDPGALSGVLEPIRKKHDLPALAAAVVRRGELAASGAVGVRKLKARPKVALNDEFHIGSCTKAMTATLVAMLVEQKKLTWQTTLQQALPDYAQKMHPDYRNATIEQLLCARAGFPGETAPKGKSLWDVHNLPGDPPKQRQAYVGMILAQGPENPPGRTFVYSNAGYVVAGAIVEQWTKSSWEEAIRKLLFNPLGMRTAGFGSMGAPGKIDQPLQHSGTGGARKPVEPGPHSDNPLAIGPAGTVHCSIGDWAKFAQLHLGRRFGGRTLLTPATLKKLHTPLPGGEYAAGWIAAERPWGGGTVLNHAGSNTMNYAVVWLAPLKNFAVLVATNQGDDVAAAACDEVAGDLIGKYPPG